MLYIVYVFNTWDTNHTYCIVLFFFSLKCTKLNDLTFLPACGNNPKDATNQNTKVLSLNKVGLNNESEIREHIAFGAIYAEKQIDGAEVWLQGGARERKRGREIGIFRWRGTRLTALLSASSLTTDHRGSERISSLEMSKVSQ